VLYALPHSLKEEMRVCLLFININPSDVLTDGDITRRNCELSNSGTCYQQHLTTFDYVSGCLRDGRVRHETPKLADACWGEVCSGNPRNLAVPERFDFGRRRAAV